MRTRYTQKWHNIRMRKASPEYSFSTKFLLSEDVKLRRLVKLRLTTNLIDSL